MGVETNPLIPYFTSLAVVSAGISAAFPVSGSEVESDWVAVESVVWVAVDSEPQADSVSATPRAKINVTFFIYSKYTILKPQKKI